MRRLLSPGVRERCQILIVAVPTVVKTGCHNDRMHPPNSAGPERWMGGGGGGGRGGGGSGPLPLFFLLSLFKVTNEFC